ncbi:MAG: hypothetical protein MRZ79_08265 [Bacteroidia bacterium]|nr:hypothetical protein [Bacteroidia bacterium]
MNTQNYDEPLVHLTRTKDKVVIGDREDYAYYFKVAVWLRKEQRLGEENAAWKNKDMDTEMEEGSFYFTLPVELIESGPLEQDYWAFYEYPNPFHKPDHPSFTVRIVPYNPGSSTDPTVKKKAALSYSFAEVEGDVIDPHHNILNH